MRRSKIELTEQEFALLAAGGFWLGLGIAAVIKLFT